MTTAPIAPQYERRRVGWLSLAQLVTWGSVFYTFSLLLEPVERELGLSRAQSSLALVEQLHRLVSATDVEGFSPNAAVAVARLAEEACAAP